MSDFLQGLTVSLLGIIITFIALGVFILIMIVLQRLFPYKEGEQEQPASLAEAEPAQAPEKPSAGLEEGEAVAAIAAALAYLRFRGNPQLGNSLQEGRSRWWFSRRLEAIEGKTRKR